MRAQRRQGGPHAGVCPVSAMPTKPWFPTLIYQSPLQGEASASVAGALVADCRAVRDGDADGLLWCQTNYPAGYTSYETLRHLHRTSSPFKGLERKIWRHVTRFARRLDMDLREAQLAMTDCWVNIMSRDAIHPGHVHPGAVFSGTFYVSTPPGCSAISFHDPRADLAAGTPPKLLECRPENKRTISYPAQAGTVILFESWLRHEVPANPTVEERISVSFNYAWV